MWKEVEEEVVEVLEKMERLTCNKKQVEKNNKKEREER